MGRIQFISAEDSNSHSPVRLRTGGFESAERHGAAAAGRRQRFRLGFLHLSGCETQITLMLHFPPQDPVISTILHKSHFSPGLFYSPFIMMVLDLKSLQGFTFSCGWWARHKPAIISLFISSAHSQDVDAGNIPLWFWSFFSHSTWFTSAVPWFRILNVNHVWDLSVDPQLGCSCQREKEIKEKKTAREASGTGCVHRFCFDRLNRQCWHIGCERGLKIQIFSLMSCYLGKFTIAALKNTVC